MWKGQDSGIPSSPQIRSVALEKTLAEVGKLYAGKTENQYCELHLSFSRSLSAVQQIYIPDERL